MYIVVDALPIDPGAILAVYVVHIIFYVSILTSCFLRKYGFPSRSVVDTDHRIYEHVNFLEYTFYLYGFLGSYFCTHDCDLLRYPINLLSRVYNLWI